ncbi:Phosphoribosylaminoimidazole-succinocarboxamide synthase [Symmachiella macrocystis]|uniref:Phosphoribosylaminoimidazole-succinocarboxamide synthase n=1 Tax=Symmachiella macrocystis TaxID=2527985 RepID=A0A5C6B455_9PLAN|nr:phosphoribosylaminoimidazolesuccinocarboxamide synthase [Symmachiella macrocystis]TWU07085.1 Phosphoribosylaminoimidazole-succinocarboxamide synthase [Symmachiella macrocystis]
MSNNSLLQSSIPGMEAHRGKVRDVYEFGDKLLFVATDRISAFDWVLPTGIPDKGRVLTQMSKVWFDRLDVRNHLISMDMGDLDLPDGVDVESLDGRSMVVLKTEVFPVECVVRGYLSGSGWKEYQETGRVCGIQLPAGMKESDKLAEPIFTPATKETSGHDINISFEQMCEIIPAETSKKLRDLSFQVYQSGADYAAKEGIIIADTKFEFGHLDGEIILIDEVLTPDSSRFWPVDQYEPGKSQPSFDKQFVRDHLVECGWDRNSEPPALPDDIVAKTRAKYVEAYEILAKGEFPWK